MFRAGCSGLLHSTRSFGFGYIYIYTYIYVYIYISIFSICVITWTLKDEECICVLGSISRLEKADSLVHSLPEGPRSLGLPSQNRGKDPKSGTP